jgi:voltage-gated potassium channel Kch
VAEATIVFAVAAAVFDLFGSGHVSSGLVFASAALLYFVTPLAILRAIVMSGTVDREVVLGVIDAYFMIGMFFAFSYRAMGILLSGPFFGSGGDGTTPQVLFFSFTTLTTTGYGNLIPAADIGQSTAVFEMLIGQLFLVTALAKIVSAWRPSRWGIGTGPGAAQQPAPAEPAMPGELEQMLEGDAPGRDAPAGPDATRRSEPPEPPEPPEHG